MFNRIRAYFGRQDDTAFHLYGAVVDQARTPAFYADAGVPDTLDGRFDMIIMHAFLVIRRLNKAGERGEAIAQEIFDAMFLDMDRNLREIGVGDLTVPKKIKIMAKAFYGRCKAYEEALSEGNAAQLADVIERNIFADLAPPAKAASALAGYFMDCVTGLEKQENDQLFQGNISFPQFDMPEKVTP